MRLHANRSAPEPRGLGTVGHRRGLGTAGHRRGLGTVGPRWGLGAIGLLALAVALGSVSDSRAQSSRGNGGYMGVTLQDMDDELRSSYGLQRSDGVLISEVQAEGPADKAGIQRGDILLRVAGTTVSSSSDVIDKVRGMSPGEIVVVTVWRNRRETTVRVTLSERPSSRDRRGWTDDEGRHPHGFQWRGDDGDVHVYEWDGGDFEFHEIPMPDMEHLRRNAEDIRRNVEVIVGSRARLGVRTQDLNDQLGEYFQVPGGKGVLVIEVLEDTPAEKAGIRAGDVIVGIDGESVGETGDISRRLREKDDEPVRVEIVRRGSKQTLTAQLEKREVPRRMSINAPRAPRAPHAPRAYRYYAPRSGERMEMERDMERLRREMRELERDMERLRREMRRDGS